MHICKRENGFSEYSVEQNGQQQKMETEIEIEIQLKINSAGFSNSNSNCVFAEAWIKNIDFQLILILFVSVLACANGDDSNDGTDKNAVYPKYPTKFNGHFACCLVVARGYVNSYHFPGHTLCKSLLILALGHI